MRTKLTGSTQLVITRPYEMNRRVVTLANLLADNDIEELLPMLHDFAHGRRSAMIGGGAGELFMVERL